MTVRFYNTLTHGVEEFKPISEGKIKLYTCGPTVYDYAHIGNFRSYVFEDLVKRYFSYLGY
ncbi:MAG: cysteine--tRNA ligase, partial [Candidatus Aminicenantes bacterium]|nr:cysteine--tRNA ligase [Candidatus Aminicenantes bacterium]